MAGVSPLKNFYEVIVLLPCCRPSSLLSGGIRYCKSFLKLMRMFEISYVSFTDEVNISRCWRNQMRFFCDKMVLRNTPVHRHISVSVTLVILQRMEYLPLSLYHKPGLGFHHDQVNISLRREIICVDCAMKLSYQTRQRIFIYLSYSLLSFFGWMRTPLPNVYHKPVLEPYHVHEKHIQSYTCDKKDKRHNGFFV